MKIQYKRLLIGLVVIGFTVGGVIITIYPFFLAKEVVNKNIENYSALVLSFLTFIYVLLTYFILRSNNKATKEQLRPYVIVTFPMTNGNINFTISNIGKRPAHNVLVNISPDLDEFQMEYLKGNYKGFLKQQFIAPGQELKCYLFHAGYLIGSKEKKMSKCYSLNISYKDYEGFIYNEKYEIDIANYVLERDIAKRDFVHYLDEIHKELKSIDENFKKYLQKIE